MSEKRFKYGRAFPINSDDSLPCITDRQDEKDYVRMNDLVDLLNEQQATISALKEENDILKQKLRKNYIDNKQYEEMKRLQEENEQLRTQLLICQQSKKDDGRFQVWEVPPITMGKRISFTTNNDGDGV